MKAAMPQTVWITGCKSWYLGKDGLPELFPWVPQRHRELLAHRRLPTSTFAPPDDVTAATTAAR